MKRRCREGKNVGLQVRWCQLQVCGSRMTRGKEMVVVEAAYGKPGAAAGGSSRAFG